MKISGRLSQSLAAATVSRIACKERGFDDIADVAADVFFFFFNNKWVVESTVIPAPRLIFFFVRFYFPVRTRLQTPLCLFATGARL